LVPTQRPGEVAPPDVGHPIHRTSVFKQPGTSGIGGRRLAQKS